MRRLAVWSADFLPSPDLRLELLWEGDGRRLQWTAPSAHGQIMAAALSMAEVGA